MLKFPLKMCLFCFPGPKQTLENIQGAAKIFVRDANNINLLGQGEGGTVGGDNSKVSFFHSKA